MSEVNRVALRLCACMQLIVTKADGSVVWEEGSNRTLVLSPESNGDSSYTVECTWGDIPTEPMPLEESPQPESLHLPPEPEPSEPVPSEPVASESIPLDATPAIPPPETQPDGLPGQEVEEESTTQEDVREPASADLLQNDVVPEESNVLETYDLQGPSVYKAEEPAGSIAGVMCLNIANL